MVYCTNPKSRNNKNYAAFSNLGIVLEFSVINPERRMHAIHRTWGRSGVLLESPCCANTRHTTEVSLIALRFLPGLFFRGLLPSVSAVLCGCVLRSLLFLLLLSLTPPIMPLWVWVLCVPHLFNSASVVCRVDYATFDYAAFDYAKLDYASGSG